MRCADSIVMFSVHRLVLAVACTNRDQCALWLHMAWGGLYHMFLHLHNKLCTLLAVKSVTLTKRHRDDMEYH